MPDIEPTFEQWVHYCFTFGYSDFMGDTDDEERQSRFDSIPVRTLTEYAIRLFSDPAFIADRYEDHQIGSGIWFIFGCGSGYFHQFRDADVPQELQAAVYEAVPGMYTELFDRVCNMRGTDLDADYSNSREPDSAVYMIWDLDCIEGPILFAHRYPHLVEPSFRILETALFKCRASSCKISALHGLGHAQQYHPERILRIIDRFLALPVQPDFLRDYAHWAGRGMVQ